MSAKNRQDPAGPSQPEQNENVQGLPGSGSGAASALERIKAEHDLRHKRQHGARTAGPGHDEDSTPQR